MNPGTGEVLTSKIYESLDDSLKQKFSMQIDSENLTPRKQKQLETTGRTKVGVNDPCPCGSGKKFKKCHRY